MKLLLQYITDIVDLFLFFKTGAMNLYNHFKPKRSRCELRSRPRPKLGTAKRKRKPVTRRKH